MSDETRLLGQLPLTRSTTYSLCPLDDERNEEVESYYEEEAENGGFDGASTRPRLRRERRRRLSDATRCRGAKSHRYRIREKDQDRRCQQRQPPNVVDLKHDLDRENHLEKADHLPSCQEHVDEHENIVKDNCCVDHL